MSELSPAYWFGNILGIIFLILIIYFGVRGLVRKLKKLKGLVRKLKEKRN